VSGLDKFDALRGLPLTDFLMVAGGSLVLYFGDRVGFGRLTTWRLHLESAWRLEGPRDALAGSYDFDNDGRPPDVTFTAFNELVGKTIEAVTVGAPVLDVSIMFEGGFRLVTFAHSIVDGENWELRHHSGLRVGMRGVTECAEWQEAED